MLPEKRRKQVYVFGGRYPLRANGTWTFNLLGAPDVVVCAWNDAIHFYKAHIDVGHMFAVEQVNETQMKLQVIHVSWMAEFNDIVCPDAQEGSTFVVRDQTLATAVWRRAKELSPEMYE